MRRYLLKAYVYIHVQDLNKVKSLEQKAIMFAKERNFEIVGVGTSDIDSLIRLLSRIEINILLMNNASLVAYELKVLHQYCKRKKITIIHYER